MHVDIILCRKSRWRTWNGSTYNVAIALDKNVVPMQKWRTMQAAYTWPRGTVGHATFCPRWRTMTESGDNKYIANIVVDPNPKQAYTPSHIHTSSRYMTTRKHFSTFVRKITLIIVISSIPFLWITTRIPSDHPPPTPGPIGRRGRHTRPTHV